MARLGDVLARTRGHAAPSELSVRRVHTKRPRGPGARTGFCSVCKLYLNGTGFVFISMVFMKKIKKDCCNRTTDVDLKKPFHPRSPWGHRGVEHRAQDGVAGIGIQGTHS